MKKEYLSLINDTIKYLKYLEEENGFEEFLFFKKNKKRKIEKKPIYQNKKNQSQITKKLPFSYLTEEATKKPFLPKKNTPFASVNKKTTEIISQNKTEKFIFLEKPNKMELPISNIKKIISSEIDILENPISDIQAQKISQNWKIKKIGEEISILYFKESIQGKLFLKNLSIALEIYFLPTKLVPASKLEKENSWIDFLKEQNLKLIIASDYSIWQLPNLIKHFREIPLKKEYFLAKIPLFMLPDISIYMKEPLLKKSLWQSICKKIKSL